VDARPDADRADAVQAVTTLPERAALPAASGAETAVAVPERRGPLDLLPGPLPLIGRAVSGVAGAFVPAPVARFVDGTRPMRAMRTLMEDVEEFQFTMVRKRKVTVTEEHYEDAPDSARPPEGRPTLLITRVLRDLRDTAGRGRPLTGHGAAELPADAAPAGIESRVRELPPGDEPS
jgi:hypothetical protein